MNTNANYYWSEHCHDGDRYFYWFNWNSGILIMVTLSEKIKRIEHREGAIAIKLWNQFIYDSDPKLYEAITQKQFLVHLEDVGADLALAYEKLKSHKYTINNN
jgi:hypothetical protein